MSIRFARRLVVASSLLLFPVLPAQTLNTRQTLELTGLRATAGTGQFNGVGVDAAGNLFLLVDRGDGIRVLKTDGAGSAVLAEAHVGVAGDHGVALALDPAGNVYVTGTTNSGGVSATPGAAITTRVDGSTNSFVAKFDSGLDTVFLTYLGGSRISATGLAATADAVFVTGFTYGSNLPVTSNGVQQVPASGSSQNGFVERFSSSGNALVYATYLTGVNGDTSPMAITATSADEAYVGGATSASGYPTVAALVPAMISTPSGFLTRLSAAGDMLLASTFVPGGGLTSLAMSSTGTTLLASGSVALGQFPVDTAAIPLIPANYEVLLRLPLDLSSVQSGTVLVPGTQSTVAAGPGDVAWVASDSSLTLLALTPLADTGVAIAARVNATGVIDQTVRFGGTALGSLSYAGVPVALAGVAVDASGRGLFAGSARPTASSTLLTSQTYDLPLRNAPTPALPSTVRDAVVLPTACSGSICAGSAGYLARVNPAVSASALALSVDAVPFFTVRNLGSAPANSVQVTTSAGTVTTNCPTTLAPGTECQGLLSGGMAGTLTVSASNPDTQQASFPGYAAPASTIVFSPRELDFGIQTSTSAAATRTLTVTNLGTSAQAFTSMLDAYVNPKLTLVQPFVESSSDCTATATNMKMLAAGGTCSIVLGFTPGTPDRMVQGAWLIGAQDVALSGYAQAASLSVSATTLDFGTQFTSGIHLPRYVYLSNASSSVISHSALSLAAGSGFTVSDGCPAALAANSVCRIRVDYAAAKTTSANSATLVLDQGLSVTLLGQTKPAIGTIGTTVGATLAVSPGSVTFPDAVVVTGVSSAAQTVSILNTGATAVPITLSIAGDFLYTSSCPASLPAGQTCAAVISFAPSQAGTRAGLLTIDTGSGSTPMTVALSAAATAILPIANGAVAFGSVPISQPATQFFKVAQPFTSLMVTTTGPYTVALLEDVGYGPGQPQASAFSSSLTQSCSNCYLAIRFTPQSAGAQSGTVTLVSAKNGAAYTVALSGNGQLLTGLILTPLAQDFGTVSLHSRSGSMLFTLTNLASSGASVNVTPQLLGADFVLDSSSLPGPACGGALAYTASCFVAVVFAPQSAGARSGSVLFTAGEYNSSATLTGTGSADSGLAISPLSLNFSSIAGGGATSQTVTLTNTGTVTLSVGTPTSASPAFSAGSGCGTLAAAAACAITVTYQAGSAPVNTTLTIPITNTTSSQTTNYSVTLTGTETAASSGLGVQPATTLFGPVTVGTQSTPRMLTVSNLSAKAVALTVSLPRQFVLVGAPCTALAANATCSFSLAFLPLTNGDISGTISVTASPVDGSAGSTALAYVQGFGMGSGTLTVTGGLIVNGVFNFGQVAPGQTLAQTFTLINASASGAAPVTVRRITSGPPFLAASTCVTPLATGQTCSVTVTYAPLGSAGNSFVADAGTLTIESDAASSPTILNLSGQAGTLTGTAGAAPLATYTLSQSSLLFSSTKVADASVPQQVTLVNTGTVTLHVSTLTTTVDFTAQSTCTTVLPGASCTVTVISTPKTTGTHIAALEISSDSATTLEFISLESTGTPATLTLTPAALNFGTLTVGSSATLPVTVSNSGSSAATFTSIMATGAYSAGGSCPGAGGTLAAGASCTVQVTFTPTSSASFQGTLSVATSATNLPLTASLTGVGTQSRLVISPSALAFGSIVVGAAANLNLMLQNTGTAAVSTLMLAATGDYAVTIPCPATTLAPGASCTAQVTFTPTAAGARAGTLTVTSSDPTSPVMIPLTGTGVAAGGSFTLTVDGGASSSISVTGGTPATYSLMLTPTGGFSGTVALTCAPVTAAPYATCSLSPGSIMLGQAQSATATITTITAATSSMPSLARGLMLPLLCALFPGILLLRRKRPLPGLLALILTAAAALSIGCGGKAASSNLRYAPAGTYQYQVTATSTSGTQVTQTVTLTLVVGPH